MAGQDNLKTPSRPGGRSHRYRQSWWERPPGRSRRRRGGGGGARPAKSVLAENHHPAGGRASPQPRNRRFFQVLESGSAPKATTRRHHHHQGSQIGQTVKQFPAGRCSARKQEPGATIAEGKQRRGSRWCMTRRAFPIAPGLRRRRIGNQRLFPGNSGHQQPELQTVRSSTTADWSSGNSSNEQAGNHHHHRDRRPA